MSNFKYKDVDLHDILDTTGTTSNSYFGFQYKTGPGIASSAANEIRSDNNIINSFTINDTQSLNNAVVKPVPLNNYSTVSLPTNLNQYKVRLVSSKGASGSYGAIGDIGAIGDVGQKGAKGSNATDHNGGDGGVGGDGGDGGDGGIGGDLGEGGNGVTFNLIDSESYQPGDTVSLSNNVGDVQLTVSGKLFKLTKGASGGGGIKGYRGSKGAKGAKGAQGNHASPRHTGGFWGTCGGGRSQNGSGGNTGAKGAKGAKGARGAKGEKGVKGSDGSVASNDSILNNHVELNNITTNDANIYIF